MRKYYDLGEHQIVTPTKAHLADILNAVILCHARISDTHSLEVCDGKWKYPARSCSVLFRIDLPEDNVSTFESLSGFKLTPAPRIGV